MLMRFNIYMAQGADDWNENTGSQSTASSSRRCRRSPHADLRYTPAGVLGDPGSGWEGARGGRGMERQRLHFTMLRRRVFSYCLQKAFKDS